MSIISQLQFLNSEDITNLNLCYGHHFPIEVRLLLSEFLGRRLVNVNENQLHVIEVAKSFVKDFLIEIERKSSELQDNDPTRFRLYELHNKINADSNATRIYRHLINCMIFEQQLLSKTVDNTVYHVTQSVYDLDDLVRRNEGLKVAFVTQWQAYRERYQKTYQERDHEQHEFADVLHAIEMDEFMDEFMESNRLTSECNVIVENINRAINTAQNLIHTVIEGFLKQWQQKSKFHGVEIVVDGATLDNIQSWCERLATCLWSTKEQLRVLLEVANVQQPSLQHFVHTFVNLNNKLTPILMNFVHDSFIVEHQPPQVIHKNSKFAAGVRLLIGKSLGQVFANPEVRVELLTENQVRSMGEPTNRIEYNTSDLEFSETESKMSATFRHMRIDNFRRFERKRTDSVMDEKSALCFHATINVGELSISIKKLSLPVVIIVNGSQETQALATIFWDNSFGLINRLPFDVPDQVTWSQMAVALNGEAIAYCGRGLTEQNFQFLSEKLFRTQPVNDNDLVSWSLFCKQNLPNQNFTFWHWFHSALKLTKNYLEPWADGSIIGFISRQETDRYLAESPEGTFLLRFSETNAGKISIATKLKNPYTAKTSVFHLQPFNHMEFDTRPLFKILNDLTPLKFLYPNTPKAAAFDKYRIGYVSRRSESPEYVRMSARLELVWERSDERLHFAPRGL